MTERSKEELHAVQAQNDQRARQMQAQLERLQDAVACHAAPKIETYAETEARVTVGVQYRAQLEALHARVGIESRRDIDEAPLRVHQNKPDHWWEHVAGPWERRPTLETDQSCNVIQEMMCDWLKENGIDDVEFNDYSGLDVTFYCELGQVTRLRGAAQLELVRCTQLVLALTEVWQNYQKLTDDQEERRIAWENAYEKTPGAHFIAPTRRGSEYGIFEVLSDGTRSLLYSGNDREALEAKLVEYKPEQWPGPEYTEEQLIEQAIQRCTADPQALGLWISNTQALRDRWRAASHRTLQRLLEQDGDDLKQHVLAEALTEVNATLDPGDQCCLPPTVEAVEEFIT